MMGFFKKIIVWKLNILAKMYLKRFKPQIIAVTGNVGKTSAKEAIAAVLGSIKTVRYGKGNLNNEFGVPLTIVGNWADEYYEGGNSLLFWLRVIPLSFFRWFFTFDYPEVLIMEYGADKPGDIKILANRFKPHIGVVTAVGEIPVHVEYFSGPEGVAKEKSKLVEALDTGDFAVLNSDDLAVLNMRDKTKARVITYGFGEGAAVKVSNIDIWSEGNVPMGMGFKLNYSDSFVPVRLRGSLGKSQGYAAAAAAAVGTIFGMNLVQISEALSEYTGPKGRLKILKGVKNSIIIDDTYNASPSSTHMALETLESLFSEWFPGRALAGRGTLSGKRKVAVLGDMLELGRYTIEAHESVGNFLKGFVDVLVTVGSRAKFIAESAENQMPKENIHTFDTSTDAKMKVKELIKEGDIVLVKGSQGIRMEKIVEEIMAEPERKRELLVRQDKRWSRFTSHKV